MLVLGTREGERIVLRLPDGREIELLMVRAAKGKSRIAIEAPADVKILREKLVEREVTT
jgi:sRNA-binding carbon storage regulator CsrA